MDNKRHLTEEIIKSFHNNNLTDNESISFLEHISQCDFCAEKFSNSFNSTNALRTPPDFKHSIIKKASIIKRAKALSPKFNLLKYSLRVCVSMAGAIIIIFSSNFMTHRLDYNQSEYNTYETTDFDQKRPTTHTPDNNLKNNNTKVLDAVNKTISNISNKIKLEVQNYD